MRDSININEWKRVEFCFVINRVNYYLTRQEELLSDKSFEELKLMIIHRKMINQFVIKYIHLYLTNTENILGINLT